MSKELEELSKYLQEQLKQATTPTQIDNIMYHLKTINRLAEIEEIVKKHPKSQLAKLLAYDNIEKIINEKD